MGLPLGRIAAVALVGFGVIRKVQMKLSHKLDRDHSEMEQVDHALNTSGAPAENSRRRRVGLERV